MRIFGDPERTKSLLQTVGMKEGEAIESGMLTRQIERAQRKVEAHNFDVRKNLLEYDDVANDQRKVIYRQRTELMATDDIARRRSRTCAPRSSATSSTEHMPPESVEEQWDVAGLEEAFRARLRRATRASRPGSTEDPSRHDAEACASASSTPSRRL